VNTARRPVKQGAWPFLFNRRTRSLRFLYAGRHRPHSFPYALVADNLPQAVATVTRSKHMSILDGVSLGLALGLFIYLLVALLRADQA
jgi:K+-transporting ATPase ATPase F chain